MLLLTSWLASCARSTDQTSSGSLKHYSIHGEIMHLDPDGKLATIHHNRIDGLMESMTMTFPVKDPGEFSALQVGNCIDASLDLQGDSEWLADIKHVTPSEGQCVTPLAGQQTK